MSNNLVFITGATGFIGAHATAKILKAGYLVRLSVRRNEQIEKLQRLYSEFTSQLEFVLVPDFAKPDAFVEALRDVNFVVHIASPMLGQGSDFQKDYIDPAVRGTLSVLDTAKSLPSIKRVLVMSSILALMPLGALHGPPTSIQENSDKTIEVDVNMDIPDGPIGNAIMYQGSKILAHESTKDWITKNHPNFSVFTFHPTFVVGPSLFQEPSEQVNSINKFFIDTVRTGNIIIPPIFVDVTDVANALAASLDAPIPDTQEIIITGQPTTWADIAAEVESLYPNADFKLKPTVEEGPSWSISPVAANKYLKIEWKSLREVISGVLGQQLKLEG
ncbi:NAD dependent epimerase dehydratase [Fusarium subglutinans]|uniref:NAD dependent epimerase dehydratase n=1 Tax=Gibberella subglutinans TaxID=42677 RepID=A0A8H5V2X7_GIBSU|nr:NAD dependent epimerase dehydratase [Fusarium subglutinans]KAF5606304.1 NAD dependent epimerase dehydratase [Fusarium subglutinans]